jgi:hypothetical protein
MTPHSLQLQEMEEHWSLRQNYQAHIIHSFKNLKSNASTIIHSLKILQATAIIRDILPSIYRQTSSPTRNSALLRHSLKSLQTNLNLTLHSFIGLDTSQPHAAHFLNSTHISVITRSADKIHLTVFISKTPRVTHIRLVRSTGRLHWRHWPRCWNPDP